MKAVTAKPKRGRGPTKADPAAVLVSYGDMAYSDEWGYWRGTLTGDVAGRAEFHEQPKNFEKDGIEYYFEDFTIETDGGDLRGTKNGVYDLKTGEFWDHGSVAEATGRWARLQGYLIFEKARTTTPGVFPMIGHHTPAVLVAPRPRPGKNPRALICRTHVRGSIPARSRRGTLSGGLSGDVEFVERPASYVNGDTEYFSETFTVAVREGTLRGIHVGERNRTTQDFWACGNVAETSGSLDRMTGAMTILWGRAFATQDSPVDPEGPVFIVVPVRAD